MARRHDFAGRCDRDRQGPRRSGIRTFTRSGFPRAAVRLLMCTTWTSGDVRFESAGEPDIEQTSPHRRGTGCHAEVAGLLNRNERCPGKGLEFNPGDGYRSDNDTYALDNS